MYRGRTGFSSEIIELLIDDFFSHERHTFRYNIDFQGTQFGEFTCLVNVPGQLERYKRLEVIVDSLRAM